MHKRMYQKKFTKSNLKQQKSLYTNIILINVNVKKYVVKLI